MFLTETNYCDGKMCRADSLPGRLPPRAFRYQPEENRYVCSEGKVLHPEGRSKQGPGLVYKKRGRSVARPEESSAVMAFRRKMASEEAQTQYRRRGRVVEFCHAWIKSKLGSRQFHVRGLGKVQMEMLWLVSPTPCSTGSA